MSCFKSFHTDLRSFWRNWNASLSRCLLEPMVHLRRSMLLVYIMHNLKAVLCKASLYLKSVPVAQLPSFVDCIWGANRWECSLVGQTQKTTHVTEAAPTAASQEVFGHHDHESLQLHFHGTSKMRMGPSFLLVKHMLKSRLQTSTLSKICKEHFSQSICWGRRARSTSHTGISWRFRAHGSWDYK